MAADFTYLVLGLPLGIAAFTLAVTGLALSAGLMITLAGIPVLLGTLALVRGFAASERMRAQWLLGTRSRAASARSRAACGSAPARSPATRPHGGTRSSRSSCCRSASPASRSPSRCGRPRSVPHLTGLGLGDAQRRRHDPLLDSTSLGYSVLRVLIGLALLPTTAVACRALAAGTGSLARALLR